MHLLRTGGELFAVGADNHGVLQAGCGGARVQAGAGVVRELRAPGRDRTQCCEMTREAVMSSRVDQLRIQRDRHDARFINTMAVIVARRAPRRITEQRCNRFGESYGQVVLACTFHRSQHKAALMAAGLCGGQQRGELIRQPCLQIEPGAGSQATHRGVSKPGLDASFYRFTTEPHIAFGKTAVGKRVGAYEIVVLQCRGIGPTHWSGAGQGCADRAVGLVVGREERGARRGKAALATEGENAVLFLGCGGTVIAQARAADGGC